MVFHRKDRQFIFTVYHEYRYGDGSTGGALRSYLTELGLLELETETCKKKKSKFECF